MALLESRIGSVQEARMIDINVNNIFFRSYSVDPNSGHAIYVFDSTYLPAPDEIGDKQVYDLLINALK